MSLVAASLFDLHDHGLATLRASTHKMPLSIVPTFAMDLGFTSPAVALACYTGLVYLLYLTASTAYDVFSGPLSVFPGPKLNALSILPVVKAIWTGNEVFKHVEWHSTYGEVVRTGPNRLSFMGNAQTWKDIYGFAKAGEEKPHKDPVFYSGGIDSVPNVFSANEFDHSRHRKVLANAFNDRALREQEPIIKKWTSLLCSKLKESAQSGESVNMLKMLNCTTFDVMADLCFAESLDMLKNSEYVPWVQTTFDNVKAATRLIALKLTGPLARLLLEELVLRFPAIRNMAVEHAKYTQLRVDRRLAKTPDRNDIWSRILEHGHGPSGLSREEHYANANLFMIAGTETSAAALSGAVYHLLSNPHQMEALKKEIRSSFSTFDDLQLNTLARCKYLGAVLKEAIRLYPPVPQGTPRITPNGGCTINGYHVPGNVNVSIHALTSFTSPRRWKDPQLFRPERWLGDSTYASDTRDAFEPFSVGPQNCLGQVRTSPDIRTGVCVLITYHRTWLGMRCD